MVVAPGNSPLTIPDAEPIVAYVGALLLQVPPVNPSPKVVVAPTHTCVTPVIKPGDELTVIVVVAAQPVGNV
jgi:hypothetical protein